MNLFDVYPLFDITPAKAKGSYIWDTNGDKYLDLYGGHAVISIGHSHPEYIRLISEQLNKIGFYSNAISNPLQIELAEKLGRISNCEDYNLFLCNSGAEANENAIKLASFYNGKQKVIAFNKSFHGRTCLSLSVTDNPKISAPVNQMHNIIFLPLNELNEFENTIRHEDNICAVIIEGIQGIGGIRIPDEKFLLEIEKICKKQNIALILDEVQSGYGRTGKFFYFQYSGIKPDIITTAKGMGNGFPVGGVLISNKFNSEYGMMGTTFGGNHLACAASIAVLNVMQRENLIENALKVGDFLISELKKIPKIKEVRGKGLMIGIEFESDINEFRKNLLFDYKIFTGISGKNVIRLLPPLSLKKQEAEEFLEKFNVALLKEEIIYG